MAIINCLYIMGLCDLNFHLTNLAKHFVKFCTIFSFISNF